MRRSTRRRRSQELRRNVWLATAGAVVATLALIALGPNAPTSEGDLPAVVIPDKYERPFANGKTLGVEGAPVVMEEFSDYG